jgi:hypothetical protein
MLAGQAVGCKQLPNICRSATQRMLSTKLALTIAGEVADARDEKADDLAS